MTTIPRAIFLVLVTPLLASSCSDASIGRSDPTLEEIQGATAKYQDVNVAIADGYSPDPLNICEMPVHMDRPAALGAMGIHYLQPELLQTTTDETRLDVRGTHTDFLRPAVLVYEPQEDGSLELVAVENLVLAEAWESEGNRRPPTLHGVEFEYAGDDPQRSLRAHYDQHLWIFRENPAGVTAPYNTDVTCEHHVREMPMSDPSQPHH